VPHVHARSHSDSGQGINITNLTVPT